MNSYAPYFLMAGIFILIICTIFFARKQHVVLKKVGFICWISLLFYFLIEYIVIRASTVSYSFFQQPMSDLGVTTCGKNTYILASYEICSPYHLLMNWTFTITGLVILTGSIGLHQFWPYKQKTKIATALLITFGISYSISGIVPANLHFLWHTLSSFPGMIVQIPALLIIGISIRKARPKLALWTFFCSSVTTISLLLILLLPLFPELPGGLLQRTLYGSVYLWMAATALVLWRKEHINVKDTPSKYTSRKI
ncbi:DUF998 domain-containing protein [Priestia filamentosa]|uniref:DUF998 domain-containing protein n=1 Tax=Priestia filamentosa TaxID=1402861 RepID=UPI0002EF1F9C|nr:DUF998 domain-containing protein [Priestia filamentosa]